MKYALRILIAALVAIIVFEAGRYSQLPYYDALNDDLRQREDFCHAMQRASDLYRTLQVFRSGQNDEAIHRLEWYLDDALVDAEQTYSATTRFPFACIAFDSSALQDDRNRYPRAHTNAFTEGKINGILERLKRKQRQFQPPSATKPSEP